MPVTNSKRQHGLTLVEMLVSLVLSSIIFMSSYQVISNLIQYQVRARSQNEVHLDKLLLDTLLSQVIEKGINQYDLYYRNQKSTLFLGDSESLQIMSRAYSNRYDKPGYRVYRLYLRDNQLFVSYRAYDKNYNSNPRFELATGIKIKNMSFEFFDQGEWLDEWSDDREIPEFIRINVDLPGVGPDQWVRGTSRR